MPARSAARASSARRPRARLPLAVGRRTPATALKYLAAFHRKLGLRGEALAEKTAFLREDASSFFRGTPSLFHADLRAAFAREAKLFPRASPRGLVNGDVHLGNFGTFRGADGQPVWGLNDFDQAGQGPVEWDLARLATSLVLTARANGLSSPDVEELPAHLMRTYAEEVALGARGSPSLGADDARDGVKKLLAKVAVKDPRKRLEKYAQLSATPALRRDHRLTQLTAAERTDVLEALGRYGAALPRGVRAQSPLEVLDVARKRGSGGSSLGLDRFYALVAPARRGQLPVLLELKELLPSPFVDLTGDLSKADAKAAVLAQRALGASYNPLTAAVRVADRSFLAREIEPEKDKLKLSKLGADDLRITLEEAAVVLARSHAQAVGATALKDWMGQGAEDGARRLTAFATRYADQVEADHAAYCRS